MVEKSRKNKKLEPPDNKTGTVFWKIIFVLLAVLLFLSLISQNSSDLSILSGGREGRIQNWIGLTGAFLSGGMFFLFGVGAYIYSLLFLVCSVQAFFPNPYYKRKGFFVSAISLIIAISILLGMWPQYFVTCAAYLGIGNAQSSYYVLSGGVIGQFLAAPPECGAGLIRRYTGTVGAAVVGLGFLCIGTIFLWRIETFHFCCKVLFCFKRKQCEDEYFESEMEKSRKKIEKRRLKPQEDVEQLKLEKLEEKKLIKKEGNETLANDAFKKVAVSNIKAQLRKKSEYKLPPIRLLRDLVETKGDSKDFIKAAKETLQDTLNSFGIEAQVTDAVTGPRVTRLEVVPSPGVRVQKISSLESNIKLDLKAESIRILAPIPGKDAVGIEIPNRASSLVPLKNIFTSKMWERNSGDIPIILGKDVAGDPVITDLARAPHLLIAGATGSGKSVCVNTLIMSLLFKFSPEELRLIMVDPKVVEFEMYQKLPHLITPIVNEPKKVPLALRWCINEMEKRYRILAKVRVKNLAGFNSRQIPADPILDDEGNKIPDHMPFIVIIIDELADIMMIAKADVETSIARIAQKARAVGIHLVLATQRPSVQIITGIIKANLPTRIAFRVTSVVDSRVILDHKGAETLLGMGDMLFIPPGSAKLDRIQGAIISDHEIEDVVSFCSVQMEQNFDRKIISNDTESPDSLFEEDSVSDDSDEHDIANDLVQQAADIICRERKASTSYLQRRLKIGYNRAAEIIDILESRGMIGPQIGSARREIFMDAEEN
jgi:DNA segregation ATPase FtsK/SpoIIIE-like protein